MHWADEYAKKMIALIPDNVSTKAGLTASLRDIVDSSKYRAPEAQMTTFQEFELVLNACIFRHFNNTRKIDLPSWVESLIALLLDMHNDILRRFG